jgi:hypothetical protein
MTHGNGNGSGKESSSVAERMPMLAPEAKATTAAGARVVRGVAPLVVAYGDVSLADSGAALIAADGSAQLVDSGAGAVVCKGDAHLTDAGASVIMAGGDIDVKNGGAMTLVAGNDMSITNGGGAVLLARGSIELASQAGSGPNVTLMTASRQVRIKNGTIGLVLAGRADLQDSRVLLSLPVGALANAAIDAGLGLADWFLGLLELRK